MPLIVDPGAEGRTFIELQNEALSDDFDSGKYRERLKTWINEAERKAFRRARLPEGEWSETITTAAGETTSLDSAFIRVNSITNVADRAALDELAIEDIDTAPASSGKPSAYALVGSELVFYPTPDAAYDLELRFQARPGRMVDDDERPLLDSDFEDLLVTFGRARLFRAEDDPEMATYYMNEFETGLTRLAADVARRTRTRRRRVPGMFAGTSSSPSFVRPS